MALYNMWNKTKSDDFDESLRRNFEEVIGELKLEFVDCTKAEVIKALTQHGITHSQFITLDMADYTNGLRRAKRVYMLKGVGEGKNNITKALDNAIHGESLESVITLIVLLECGANTNVNDNLFSKVGEKIRQLNPVCNILLAVDNYTKPNRDMVELKIVALS